MENEKKLKEIIKKVINVDIDGLPEEAKNFPLLSRRFNVQPHEMMVLLFKVEKEFNIEVDELYIENEKFNSFNGILEIISVSI